MRRVRTLVALAATFAMAGPSVASAQVDVRLNESAKWPDRELVISFPTKRVVTNEQVVVRENGRPVQGVRTTSAAANRKRGVILAIDASLTMRGDPIRSAMVAARSFAKRRDPNTPLGVIFFSGESRVALAPTTDARKIRTTLAVGPALTRGTKIFDAAATGIKALRDAGLTSGAIVVLSDGAEAQLGSAITPRALAKEAGDASVRVFSVGLDSRSFDDTALRTMASGTGGRYGEAAQPRDLPPLFAAIGERLSSEYLLTYRSTAPAGTSVAVTARVRGIPGTSELSYEAPELSFARAGRIRAEENTSLDGSRILLIAALGFAFATLILFLLLRPKQRSLVSRVADFAAADGPRRPTMDDVRQRQEREPSDRWRRYSEAVELADIGMTPKALAAWTAFGTSVFAWYLAFSAGRPALLVVCLVVPLGVRTWVVRKLNARRHDFDEQLPDNLQVLASALRAGYSFSAALASMAEDAAEPSRTELKRASTDEQLGVDISEALLAVGERMKNPEIEYVGIVARMQREVGGNTAEVLDQVIETIRERQQLKRMVNVLTAQGRLGGAMISAAPVVVAALFSVVTPGYFDPLFESTLGTMLFVASILMVISGWLMIRKIVDVEP